MNVIILVQCKSLLKVDVFECYYFLRKMLVTLCTGSLTVY